MEATPKPDGYMYSYNPKYVLTFLWQIFVDIHKHNGLPQVSTYVLCNQVLCTHADIEYLFFFNSLAFRIFVLVLVWAFINFGWRLGLRCNFDSNVLCIWCSTGVLDRCCNYRKFSVWQPNHRHMQLIVQDACHLNKKF